MSDQLLQSPREDEWWKRWRSADFSWDGLARLRWEGWAVAPNGEIVEQARAAADARPATLQDYWRDEQPHLIQGDGKQWTRLHCPMNWADGTAAKAIWTERQWEELDTLLRSKLVKAGSWPSEGTGKTWRLKGPDRRAQFSGGVLRLSRLLLDGQARLNLRCLLAYITEAIVFKTEFESLAGFDDACFAGAARFEDVRFLDRASFTGTIFLNAAVLRTLTFSEDADFRGAVFERVLVWVQNTCARQSNFAGATFTAGGSIFNSKFVGRSDFSATRFFGTASFVSPVFEDAAIFEQAKFQPISDPVIATLSQSMVTASTATMEHAWQQLTGRLASEFGFHGDETESAAPLIENFNAGGFYIWEGMFKGEADFQAIAVDVDCSFVGCKFEGEAHFEDAKFKGRFAIDDDNRKKLTIFEGNASFVASTFFDDADFDGAAFRAGADFANSVFRARAYFQEVSFGGPTNFSYGRNEGNAWFSSSEFSQDAVFNGRQFHSRADFDDAKFRAGISFGTCTFRGYARFSGATLSDAFSDFSGAFSSARFEGAADFVGAGAEWAFALNRAVLNDFVLLSVGNEGHARWVFDNKLLRGARKVRGDAQAVIKAETERRGQLKRKKLTGRERRNIQWEALDKGLAELEGGCRAVRLAAGRQRDEQLEQMYRRFELIARRHKRGGASGERTFSHLYGWFSDYGTSVARPPLILLAMVVGFAAVYWAWSLRLDAHDIPMSWPDVSFFEALRYSASRVFPFGAFGAETEPGSWLHAFVVAHGPVWEFAIRATATLESLVAVTLAFLFALAVRRRFQIN